MKKKKASLIKWSKEPGHIHFPAFFLGGGSPTIKYAPHTVIGQVFQDE